MRNPTELLINLLNLRAAGVEDVVLTIDGHFIGRRPGEPGYNAFFGKPKNGPGPGQDRTREVWETLSDSERAGVRNRAENPPDGSPSDLELFGIAPDPEPEPAPEPRIMCYFPKGHGPKGNL